MSKKKTLKDIFEDDEFGLLESKPKKSNEKSEEDRLLESFEEINSFYDENGRLPEASSIKEFKLLSRLKALRQDEKKLELLGDFDRHNILTPKDEVKSVSDIMEDDDLGILDTEDSLSIFKLKNVPSGSARADSDFVAQRQPMSDEEFSKYQPKFKQVHKELREGKRKLLDFKNLEKNLKVGGYYILDGVLLYLEEANVKLEEVELTSGNRRRTEGRTRTIFENGTYSNMLFRSLGKAIQKNGKLVTHSIDTDTSILHQNANLVNDKDFETGWIYVVKSKSKDANIANIKDLYKIGFTRLEVEKRIKNAAQESTYLMADVAVLRKYKCYNLNVQKFEHLIQRFFSKSRLNIDVFKTEGERHSAKEWFIVPIGVIDRVVELFITGDITDYWYNHEARRLEKSEGNK